jgi:hypothetical protein
LNYDLLFTRRFEIALGLGPGAEFLYSVHNVALLRQKSFTQLLCPVQLIAHHGKNFREGHKCFYAEVPFHLVQGCVQLITLEVVLLYPTIRLHNFEGKSRRHQDIGEQGIGIKGDRSNHLTQFFLVVLNH